DGRRALAGSDDRVIRLWDLEPGVPIREFRGHTEYVFSVAFSPDGRLAFSTSGAFHADGHWHEGTDSAVRVWVVETGQAARQLCGLTGQVGCVSVGRDGQRVLAGGGNMAPILWDVKTGAEIRRFRGHTGKISCVSFLPDGRRAVSGSDDGTIRLWDVET